MKLEVSFLCIYASECGQVHTSVCACLFVCFCKCVPWTQLCLFVSSAHFCICEQCVHFMSLYECARVFVCLLGGKEFTEHLTFLNQYCTNILNTHIP